LPFGNRIAIDARDPLQVDNATGASLPSEKPNQESSQAFVGCSQESIDGAMFTGQHRAGMLLAN
jgi:hypothetical protein